MYNGHNQILQLYHRDVVQNMPPSGCTYSDNYETKIEMIKQKNVNAGRTGNTSRDSYKSKVWTGKCMWLFVLKKIIMLAMIKFWYWTSILNTFVSICVLQPFLKKFVLCTHKFQQLEEIKFTPNMSFLSYTSKIKKCKSEIKLVLSGIVNWDENGEYPKFCNSSFLSLNTCFLFTVFVHT